MYVGWSQAEEGCDGRFDVGYVYDWVGAGEVLGEDFFGHVQVEAFVLQGRVGDDFYESTFEFAYVCADIVGDVLDDGFGDVLFGIEGWPIIFG